MFNKLKEFAAPSATMTKTVNHVAIIGTNVRNQQRAYTADTLEKLVETLLSLEVEEPAIIITDGMAINYEDQFYRYCYIERRISEAELKRSMQLTPLEMQIFSQLIA